MIFHEWGFVIPESKSPTSCKEREKWGTQSYIPFDVDRPPVWFNIPGYTLVPTIAETVFA
jgi:hypothetical protein